MQYEQALKIWGAKKLSESSTFYDYSVKPYATTVKYKVEEINISSVYVDMEFDKGWNCCGGRDTNCYCSMAESPSAYVEIRGETLEYHEQLYTTISMSDFVFTTVLKEVLEAAESNLTL